MLLQTNSYVVPNDKREEHARLMRRFRQVMLRLGCDSFEVYEQVANTWVPLKSGGRFIQMMRFRDRKQHQAVQAAERGDPAAQDLVREFCELVDFQLQQEQGHFAMGHYCSVLGGGELQAHESPAAPASEAEPGQARGFTNPPATSPQGHPQPAAEESSSGNSKGHPHL